MTPSWSSLSRVALALISVFVLVGTSFSDQGPRPRTRVPNLPAADTTDTVTLQPAEGANVVIVIPAPGAVFSADEIPLQFTLIKGKRGEHVHAYVDGQLMGMFKSERGTLGGITPGAHTLELRVAAEDHRTELDATDRVEFLVE